MKLVRLKSKNAGFFFLLRKLAEHDGEGIGGGDGGPAFKGEGALPGEHGAAVGGGQLAFSCGGDEGACVRAVSRVINGQAVAQKLRREGRSILGF